ncbi:Co2+/Mg2+ efflux protein ApaG [Deinococcus irradiatisoli]|uniref:Co2+/Mg2+ efflux protein ApaG n=1 Tax=Deinococcus irradiatisoli TaxID=2202254 RepID=A0A2Z3JHH2_9DEIO|nr:Co2+/Mg2+ efflux protein ApaG [Deinococcus irradiatisoli]AWN24455.1 Co2+/Mg2+ efflux protein ApaG [Deinococcus irradiatisoli]
MSDHAPPELAAPDVRVSVNASHLPAYSQPGRQVFSYVIRIENHAAESWQIVAREWLITDGGGRQTRVQGEGVVGEQPVIAPCGVFVYDSFVTLEDLPGSMSGHYEVRDAWNQRGRVPIPAFALALPEPKLLN